MKDVQQQGGPFEQQNVHVGEDRQLTIDTTNRRILLHDGETPGGKIFVSRDEGDQRWMERILELNGFNNFAVGAKGFPARTAAATYAIRVIMPGAGISISNGDGSAGNPIISLDDELPGDYVFQGSVEFEQIILGTGFIGDTQGDHTGDVLGNLTGNVTGDLTGDSTGTHTGPVVGAVDARGETFQVDADAIPMSAIAGLAAALGGIPAGVPTGTIVMWSGTSSDIPAGWELCNGDNGTPDLRDRFIVAADDTFVAHSTGGTATHTPAGTIDASGTHAHNGTVSGTAISIAQMPAHLHGSGVCDNATGDIFNRGSFPANPITSNSVESNSADGIHEGTTSSAGSGEEHDHGLTIDNAGNHTHGFSGTEASYLPPYYALVFIMKV